MDMHTVKCPNMRAGMMIAALLVASGSAFGADTAMPIAPTQAAAPAAADTKRDTMATVMLLSEIEMQAAAGKMPMPCFISNPTPEQLAEILNRWGAHPMGEFTGGPGLRFWTATNQWNSTGTGTTAAAQGKGTTLTYSFPPDGTTWFNCNASGNFPNELTANLTASFGAGNEDKGRELIRQGLTGWRRYANISYNEVADDGAAFGTSSAFSSARGTMRIGAVNEGAAGGILACNNFPTSGGDQSINSFYFDPSHFLSTANNYRYLHNVLGHEHGHGLGAGHPVPCDNTKLMEPFINTNFDLLQLDDRRFATRNYGDRFSGNTIPGTAKDFGTLDAGAQPHSVLEKDLSTNGVAGLNASNLDWFKFTITSPQDVTITVTPTGNDYSAGTQSSGCTANESPIPTDHALVAGNLDVTLYASDGATIVTDAPRQVAGVAETIDRTAAGPNGQLPAGTYYVRVIDSGGANAVNDQYVQMYDFLVRVGSLKAPPKAVAGVNKRCLANTPCFFLGNVSSYATETGTAIANYNWDFDGDGSYDTPLSQPSFTYVSNGVYNVVLKVTANTAGGSLFSTDTITVTVTGATGLVTGTVPGNGNQGLTVPVTITGKNFKGVTSLSQITVSGTGVTVVGTPVANLLGTQITGLSFQISGSATLGARNITITNSDGQGNNASGNGVFTVIGPPPGNDECSAPGNLGNASGTYPFDTTGASTSASPNPTGFGCSGPITNDLWYTWTSPGSGTVYINTTGTSYLSRMSVYTSTGCPPLAGSLSGCAEPGSQVVTLVGPGQQLLIQVGSQSEGATGTGSVVINFQPSTIGCCLPNGTCSDLALSDCTSQGGTQGALSCASSPCSVACCLPNGTCLDISSANCTSQGGTPGSGGSVCASTNCPQPSAACCFANGSCLDLTSAACTSQSGTLQGSGSVCASTSCPQPNGVCCNGAVCFVNVPASSCTGPHTLFVATANCNASGNFKTPCCKADYNKLGGITVQDLFDYLTAWFAKDISADINGATPTGGSGSVTVQDLFDFLGAWFAKGCP